MAQAARFELDRAPWITVAVGRYLLEEELGRGAMGRVHRGWDPLLGRPVAIKLAAPRRDRARHDERLLSEARAASRIQHRNVVRVLDAGREQGCAFLVMELVEGPSLAEWLRSPRDVRDVLRVVQRLASALEHVHAAGLVHRDVKPENVLMDGEEPVLIDFGLAISPTLPTPPRSGPAGTLPWMAPEQARGESERIGPWSDVYGLGALLFSAFGGGPPHDADSPWSFLLKLASEPAPSLAERCPFLAPELTSLVDRCLELDPDARPSAGELAAGLERLLTPSRRAWSSRLLARVRGLLGADEAGEQVQVD